MSLVELLSLNLESKMLLLYERQLLSIKAAYIPGSSDSLDDDYGFAAEEEYAGDDEETTTAQSSRPSKKSRTTG